MRLLLLAVLVLAASEGGFASQFQEFDPGATIDSILTCGGPPPFLGFNPNGNHEPILSPFSHTYPGGQPSIPTMMILLNTMGPDFDPDTQQHFQFPVILPTQALEPSPVCNQLPNPQEENLLPSDYFRLYTERFAAENLTSSGSSDFFRQMQSVIDVLDCRPGSNWLDAGNQFFPRFLLTGFCNARRCSMPDRSNFLCRPDLTNPSQIGMIHTNRWDCCYNSRNDFMCGWRRVVVPVVCDCDCECGADEVNTPARF